MRIERTVNSEPITCEHCGFIQREFITYECGCSYCSDCAFANGDIDIRMSNQDEEDNYRLYEEWLRNELRDL